MTVWVGAISDSVLFNVDNIWLVKSERGKEGYRGRRDVFNNTR